MRLAILFLLCCGGLYEAATTERSENSDASPETTLTEGNLRYVLEMLLGWLENIDHKLLDLQYEVSEHREEVERNRVTSEKTFSDIIWAIYPLDQDVGRNMSVLQDRSLVILDQKKSCANHEKLREKLVGHIPKQNLSAYKTRDVFRSRNSDFSSSTSSSLALDSTTPSTPASPIYASCKDAPANVSGIYFIRVHNDSSPFKVYCEQMEFGGGWIVMQHRFDGSVDFYLNWTHYRDGFGEVDKEFWLGLEHIHQLTTARTHELLVEVKDFYGNYGYSRYNLIQIGSESEKYSLKNVVYYNGTAGDSLTPEKGKKFSTPDSNNDGSSGYYAVSYEGSWWHYGGYANLNGRYKNAYGAYWWYFLKNDTRGLSFSRMMIREL